MDHIMTMAAICAIALAARAIRARSSGQSQVEMLNLLSAAASKMNDAQHDLVDEYRKYVSDTLCYDYKPALTFGNRPSMLRERVFKARSEIDMVLDKMSHMGYPCPEPVRFPFTASAAEYLDALEWSRPYYFKG